MSNRPDDCDQNCEVCVLDIVQAGEDAPPLMSCAFAGVGIVLSEDGQVGAGIVFALGAEGQEPVRFSLLPARAVKLLGALRAALGTMDAFVEHIESGSSDPFDPKRLSRS